MKAQTYELNRFWVVIYIAFPISVFILILTTTYQHFALKNVNQYSDTTNQLTIRYILTFCKKLTDVKRIKYGKNVFMLTRCINSDLDLLFFVGLIRIKDWICLEFS